MSSIPTVRIVNESGGLLAAAKAALETMTVSRNEARARLERMTAERERFARELALRHGELKMMREAETKRKREEKENAASPLQQHRQWMEDNPGAEARWMSEENCFALEEDVLDNERSAMDISEDGTTRQIAGVAVMVAAKATLWSTASRPVHSRRATIAVLERALRNTEERRHNLEEKLRAVRKEKAKRASSGGTS